LTKVWGSKAKETPNTATNRCDLIYIYKNHKRKRFFRNTLKLLILMYCKKEKKKIFELLGCQKKDKIAKNKTVTEK